MHPAYMACEFPVAVKAKLMLTAIHRLFYLLYITALETIRGDSKELSPSRVTWSNGQSECLDAKINWKLHTILQNISENV